MIYGIIKQILKTERELNTYDPTETRSGGSATDPLQNISNPNLLFGRNYLQTLAFTSIITGSILFQ
jgi:hypothetical protein